MLWVFLWSDDAASIARDSSTQKARIEQELIAAAEAAREEQARIAAAEVARKEEARRAAEAARKEQARLAAEAARIPELPPIRNSLGMELKLIPAGRFIMGSAAGEADADETPHEVVLTQHYYLGVHEVTQQQYLQVMGSNPSYFEGPQSPVENVSWEDAVEFCRKLSALSDEQAEGRVYRLPTEAEWEYACRAGAETEFSFGNGEQSLVDYPWIGDNSGRRPINAKQVFTANREKYDALLLSNGCRTHRVGLKKPNAWGLHDMHGNVWEWCQDWYNENYFGGEVTDPAGPKSGSDRVYRGGSWTNFTVHCRSANRRGHSSNYRHYSFGFRVACTPSAK